MKDILTIHIQRSESGLFLVTCDQHRGLLSAERSLSEAVASVMSALRDLLSVGPAHPDPHAFDGIDLAEPRESGPDAA